MPKYIVIPDDSDTKTNFQGEVNLDNVNITGGTITGITDLAVADGGTGASTAAQARTNLDAQEDLSGATLTAVTVAADDKVLIQDTSNSNNLKTVTAQSIADLAAGGTSEQIQDIVGAMFSGNTETNVTVDYQDSDGTIDVVVPSAGDATAGVIEIAVQSEMETGSDTTRAVVPGRQQFHPSAAKGWVKVQPDGTVTTSYNVTSVASNGTGDITITWGTDFSSADFCVVASVHNSTPLALAVSNTAAGTTRVLSYTLGTTGADPAAADPTYYYVVAYGDQA